MGNKLNKWLQVTLTKRSHTANQDGITATWCWSDVTSIKGTVFGEQTDSKSKNSASLSILQGGVNIAKSSGLGVFLWMNNYDDTYATTIIDTYGDKAYVSLQFKDGVIIGYEMIDSEHYAQMSDEEKSATMSLPTSQPVFAS